MDNPHAHSTDSLELGEFSKSGRKEKEVRKEVFLKVYEVRKSVPS